MELKEQSLRVFVWSVRDLFTYSVLTPAFLVFFIALTLTLQRLFPAKPNQAILSLGFAQNLVWLLDETILHAIVIVTYVQLLTMIYRRNFQFLTITAAVQWPGWLRLGVGILLLDFLYWGQHFTNHKVSVFWRFHTVHHSQKELNFFTDFRYHILEYIVRHTWLVIPFLMLQVDPPQIVWFSIIAKWYTRFYHGNIRTNLGPLRYVLVTPQFHRIHHSVERRHRDTNFGALFSIWDRLFGTQYRGYDEYPETGIEDEAFPHEKVAGVTSLLLRPLVRMVYPFRQTQEQYAASPSIRQRAPDRAAREA